MPRLLLSLWWPGDRRTDGGFLSTLVGLRVSPPTISSLGATLSPFPVPSLALEPCPWRLRSPRGKVPLCQALTPGQGWRALGDSGGDLWVAVMQACGVTSHLWGQLGARRWGWVPPRPGLGVCERCRGWAGAGFSCCPYALETFQAFVSVSWGSLVPLWRVLVGLVTSIFSPAIFWYPHTAPGLPVIAVKCWPLP